MQMNDATRKKRDFLFVYMMIIALILFVSGFYFGGAVVKNKYNEKIEQIREEYVKEDSEITIKYLQTDFVSFYYGVLEPFNHLKMEHFAYANRVNSKDQRFDYKAKSKELLELSRTVLDSMNKTIISESAPLLKQSKDAYIDSIKHYQRGIGALLNKESLPEEINRFNTGWLLAQKLFYESVVEWEKIYYNSDSVTFAEDETDYYELSITKWKLLTLHQKNYVLSLLMEQKPYVIPYQPEDITVHIDPLSQHDDLFALGIDSIGKAVDVFIAANAINFGDFYKEKDRFYSDVETPLIPLYLTK